MQKLKQAHFINTNHMGQNLIYKKDGKRLKQIKM
jgi:hypothetical protein